MSVEYDAIIYPDGRIITEVTKHDGNCNEIEKIVSRVGVIKSTEKIDDDFQPIFETVNN
jgi:hypothetical protein